MSRTPTILERADHQISRRNIDQDALKVLNRLDRFGYKAYLVGGGVRDLLLGRHPKDFDVSTDAHPNQIKKLFRNCFLVGRRFRLAHIRFGQKIIETSTFRRPPDGVPDEDDVRGGYQHRDNSFGTPEEDAQRRDFTINGLFYDISTFKVIDHVKGLDDLKRKTVRSIGDPNIRFVEDPVRMIRAIRFASRLGFKIERRALRAIKKHAPKVLNAPPSRLAEEVFRLFPFSSSEAAFRLLYETGVMKHLLPELHQFLRKGGARKGHMWKCLAALDDLSRKHEASQALQLAVLYWPMFKAEAASAIEGGDWGQFMEVAHHFLPRNEAVPLPRRVTSISRHILLGQRRIIEPGRRFSKERFAERQEFADIVALARIDAIAQGRDLQFLEPWERLVVTRSKSRRRKRGGDKGREGGEKTGTQGRRRRRPRRRRRKPASTATPAS